MEILVGSIPIISGPFNWKSALHFHSESRAMRYQWSLLNGALAAETGCVHPFSSDLTLLHSNANILLSFFWSFASLFFLQTAKSLKGNFSDLFFSSLKNSDCYVCNQWPASKIITFAFQHQNLGKLLSFLNLFLHKILKLFHDRKICNFCTKVLLRNKIFYNKMHWMHVIWIILYHYWKCIII